MKRTLLIIHPGALGDVLLAVPAIRRRCDRAVVWMEDKEGVLGSFFQEFGVPNVQIQSPFSKGLRARHQSDRFLETLGEPTRDSLSERTVQVPPHLLERGKDYLDALRISQEQSLVLVHPGSGSVHKRLEPRRTVVAGGDVSPHLGGTG